MFAALAVLGALSVGAMSGWWAILAVVLAALLAEGVSRTGCRARSAREQTTAANLAVVSPLARPAVKGINSAAEVVWKAALVALAAQVFGSYVFPQDKVLSSAVLIVLASVAVLFGLRLSSRFRLWINGLLTLAALIFIVTCLAVSPAPSLTSPEEKGSISLVISVVISTAVFFPFFLAGATISGNSPRFPWRRQASLTTGMVLLIGIIAVSLYQRDFMRLGLSATPLSDVLAAADAEALKPWLVGTVVLATFSTAVAALSTGPAHSNRQRLSAASARHPVVIGSAALIFLLFSAYVGSTALLWLGALSAVGKCLLAARYR